MRYEEYYLNQFASDLKDVVTALPSSHHKDDKHTTIQARTLSLDNPVIQAWDQQKKYLFATALFWVVLVDEVCHHHYRQHHAKFESLTKYPKFVGDCPGGCHWHIPPQNIFFSIGQPNGPMNIKIPKKAALPFAGANQFMKGELQDFIEQNMPELDVQSFWSLCEHEIPPSIHFLEAINYRNSLNSHRGDPAS